MLSTSVYLLHDWFRFQIRNYIKLFTERSSKIFIATLAWGCESAWFEMTEGEHQSGQSHPTPSLPNCCYCSQNWGHLWGETKVQLAILVPGCEKIWNWLASKLWSSKPFENFKRYQPRKLYSSLILTLIPSSLELKIRCWWAALNFRLSFMQISPSA